MHILLENYYKILVKKSVYLHLEPQLHLFKIPVNDENKFVNYSFIG